MVKISILTPTYERSGFLPFLALMIAAQTVRLRDIEWVVVDDSERSQQAYFDACHLQSQLARLTYVHLPRKKPIGCKRNLAKTLAEGEYLMHMDDDDYYAPNYVDTVMRLFESARKPNLIGATTIYLMYPTSLHLFQSGPFGPKHSCAGAMSYTREYAHAHHFENTARKAEEPAFIDGNDVLQIQDLYNINMVFVHGHNTVPKESLRRKPVPTRWIDVIQQPTVLHFYLSLHAPTLPLHKELAFTLCGTRAAYGTTFVALSVLHTLQQMMRVVVRVLGSRMCTCDGGGGGGGGASGNPLLRLEPSDAS
jgi:glycosyltransferase involved in cell wall biosynthesis